MHKAVIRGHFRTLPSGKRVWVKQHTDSRPGATDGWHTLQGVHVFVRNGVVTRGPEHLRSKPVEWIGTEDEADARIEAHKAQADAFKTTIAEAGEGGMVDSETKAQYEGELTRLLDWVPTGALRRINMFCGEIRWHATTESIASMVRGVTGKLRGGANTVGAWVIALGEKGTLHLDGNGPTKDRRGIYAHELGHAIDGHRSLSRETDWQDAWLEEIVEKEQLSKYATTSPHEGFAEYWRLILTGSQRDAKDSYPKCYDFCRKAGLL